MITHPDKVLFPSDGITKGELASYYDAIAPVMLPHLRARPITMERYPSGIGKRGFMHKDVSKGFPEDICVLDLDPSGDDADAVRAAALQVRDLLGELGLTSWVKTSGAKGFHIVVPTDGESDFGEVSWFADAVAAILVERDPEHLTRAFTKADRGGRIYVDTGRNAYSATLAAAYDCRFRSGASAWSGQAGCDYQ